MTPILALDAEAITLRMILDKVKSGRFGGGGEGGDFEGSGKRDLRK